jgi:Fe-S cluster assembly protein SufD
MSPEAASVIHISSSQTTEHILLSQLMVHGFARSTDIEIHIAPQVSAVLIDDMPRMVDTRLIAVHVHEHAQLAVLSIIEDGGCEHTRVAITYHIAAHAQVDIILVHAGNHRHSTTITMFLEGISAHAQVQALSITTKEAVNELTTVQHHRAPSTQSSVVARVVGGGTSSNSYHGTIHIEEGATNSDAKQEHKALLVSSTARVIAMPILEVLTNEVTCGHGSAVGVLDEQQLFYMQARGISEVSARRLLLETFCLQAFEGVKEMELRKKIGELVQVWMRKIVL